MLLTQVLHLKLSSPVNLSVVTTHTHHYTIKLIKTAANALNV